jgi:hypothetical protein
VIQGLESTNPVPSLMLNEPASVISSDIRDTFGLCQAALSGSLLVERTELS